MRPQHFLPPIVISSSRDGAGSQDEGRRLNFVSTDIISSVQQVTTIMYPKRICVSFYDPAACVTIGCDTEMGRISFCGAVVGCVRGGERQREREGPEVWKGCAFAFNGMKGALIKQIVMPGRNCWRTNVKCNTF